MKINGKELKQTEVTFNFICQMEDMGIEIGADRKTMSMLRGFIAICLDETVEEAGEDIEKYIIDGGDMKELVKFMTDAMEESGFFQALAKKADAGKATVQKVPAKKA